MNSKTSNSKNEETKNEFHPLARDERNVFSNRVSIRPSKSFTGLKSVKPVNKSKVRTTNK